MIITSEEKFKLHRACLHDDVVVAMLTGFLARHIAEYGPGIEVISDGIERFAEAMRNPAHVDFVVRIYIEALADFRAGPPTKQ